MPGVILTAVSMCSVACSCFVLLVMILLSRKIHSSMSSTRRLMLLNSNRSRSRYKRVADLPSEEQVCGEEGVEAGEVAVAGRDLAVQRSNTLELASREYAEIQVFKERVPLALTLNNAYGVTAA